jgi:phosphatidylserine/phosphatidylglycerophosphate/cardiolipin synthase-like enzyme
MRRSAVVCVVVAVFVWASALFSLEKGPVSQCQVLFSPDDKVAEALITMIKREDKSIKAAIYALMHRDIAKALIDAQKRGVRVEVIVDPFSVKSRSPLKKMVAANLPLFVWNPPVQERVTAKGRKIKRKLPLMHDKFCIFGDRKVWTGSFNFTFEAATSNRENVIILENTGVAARYLEEFEKIKRAGCVSLAEYTARRSR